MKQWLLYSLGGSDIQYIDTANTSTSKRRMHDYANACCELYENLSLQADYAELIVTPLLSSLINELKGKERQADRLVLLYTQQEKSHERDTYWAYRIIQYLAENTDYYGYRFQVTGVHIRGNPAKLTEMLSLYYYICTPEALKGWGVEENDRLAACFTAGTPAMKQSLMMAFSALNYPKERECYEVEASIHSELSKIYMLPVVELLRHEDLFQLVQERLSSKRFDEARLLLKDSSFQFLQSKSSELELIITMLHKRFLFDFNGALQCYHNLAKNSPLRERFAKEKKHLQICAEAFEMIKAHRYDNLREEKCMRKLIYEYFHKLQFFYRAKMWNEFTFLASSFYEWLLQISFYTIIGSPLVRAKEREAKQLDWDRYLANKFQSQPALLVRYPAQLKRFFQERTENNGDVSRHYNRKYYQEVLKNDTWGAMLVNSSWNAKMAELYSKIRNNITHTLTSIDENEILSILSGGRVAYPAGQWIKETAQLLETLFQDKVEQIHTIDHSIDSLIDYMQSLFQHTYVPAIT